MGHFEDASGNSRIPYLSIWAFECPGSVLRNPWTQLVSRKDLAAVMQGSELVFEVED